MSVSCNDCPKTWPEDPALAVECPTCGQPPGSRCVERAPSGHVKGAAFSGMPPWGHDERDLAAVLAGAYGECPEGKCGLQSRARRLGITLGQMVELKRGELARRTRRPEKHPAEQPTLGL